MLPSSIAAAAHAKKMIGYVKHDLRRRIVFDQKSASTASTAAIMNFYSGSKVAIVQGAPLLAGVIFAFKIIGFAVAATASAMGAAYRKSYEYTRQRSSANSISRRTNSVSLNQPPGQSDLSGAGVFHAMDDSIHTAARWDDSNTPSSNGEPEGKVHGWWKTAVGDRADDEVELSRTAVELVRRTGESWEVDSTEG
jgi:hypothetical protein